MDGGGNLLQEVQDRGTLRCGVNDAVPGLRVHGRGRRAGGLRHRLLQGHRCGGARRRRGGRVHAALGRAALHGAPVRRDRRAQPQHDVHGLARRHRGRSFPAHDVLRRAGNDGAHRIRAHHARGPRGRDDLRAFRNDDRAQPRVAVPGRRDRLHTAGLRGQRASPGGVRRGAVRRVDVGQVAARRHPLGLARGPGRSRGSDDHGRDHVEGAARPRRGRRRRRLGGRGQLGRLRHDPGRGVRPDLGQHRPRAARIPRSSASWARRSRASPSTPVSACPTTSRCRS